MKTRKLYYHVIENSGYGRIGWQGCYDTQLEAQKRVDSLREMFPQYEFYLETTTSKKEPNFITI